MSAQSNLYRLTKDDIPNAVKTFKDAFQDDPVWSKVFMDANNKEVSLSSFYTIPLLYGMKFGEAYAISSGLEGIAVWMPGEHAAMSMFGMLRSGAFAYAVKMGSEPGRNLSVIYKQLDADRKRLMRNKSYNYLSIIGVARWAQGKGHGSRLMNAIKAECDQKGLYLYLETETKRNVAFYENHGFTLLEEVSLKTLDLPAWLMVRAPQ